MFIFIDESGNFTIPSKPHRVSCVTALIIPEKFAYSLFRQFKKHTQKWKNQKREIKGSRLNESEMNEIVCLLKSYDVLVLTVAIDMGMQGEFSILTHKEDQAKKLLKAINKETSLGMTKDLKKLSDEINNLSNQLYVQFVLLNKLIELIIRTCTLYYSQRLPNSLKSFKWRLDRKDLKITKFESLWKKIISPYLQSAFISSPLELIESGDYSSLVNFYIDPPEYLESLNLLMNESESKTLFLDIKKLLTNDLKFLGSDYYSGLQLVDIVASCITRACNRTLEEKGWKNLGSLMVQSENGENCLKFCTLEEKKITKKLPYYDFVKSLDQNCKKMLVKENI